MDSHEAIGESSEDFQKFLEDPSLIHYVGMIHPPRPGVSDCVQTLEHAYYKPGTPRNNLFNLRIIKWEDITWVIVSIPITEKAKMESVAKVSGLRIANGVPMMIDSKGRRRFPASNERVFTLENVPGHPVYNN